MDRLFSYNRHKLISKLGQATTEIAVMGILILVVFGVLLRYAQMMNARQEIKMYTHRRALELAKVRRDTDKYASVSLTAMKEVFPVNIFSSEREPTYVSASSTISMHEDTMYYSDFDLNRTRPEHVGVSYYQIGADMINNNEVIVMPYMQVKRKVDKDKAPKTPWDADVNWLKEVVIFGASDSDPTDYETLEPAAIADVDQFVSKVYSHQHSSSENLADASYQEDDTLDMTQTFTYRFMDEDALEEQEDIQNLYSNFDIDQKIIDAYQE